MPSRESDYPFMSNKGPFDASFWAAVAAMPAAPSKFTKTYIGNVISRCDRRINVLQDRIGDVAAGRVMPDKDDVTIGSGRRFSVAVLFLDICGFSSRPNWLPEEQKVVVMNIFMAEMLSIVNDFGGTYEKNTGDGLMAYFGEEEKTTPSRVKPAVEAAVVMHYVNDHLISPWFTKQNIAPVRFRIGIDCGPVTIGRVGIHGQNNSLVAIGATSEYSQ